MSLINIIQLDFFKIWLNDHFQFVFTYLFSKTEVRWIWWLSGKFSILVFKDIVECGSGWLRGDGVGKGTLGYILDNFVINLKSWMVNHVVCFEEDEHLIGWWNYGIRHTVPTVNQQGNFCDGIHNLKWERSFYTSWQKYGNTHCQYVSSRFSLERGKWK